MQHALSWLILQAASPGLDVPSLQEQARTARLELEAARSKALYLVVDARSSTLAPKLAGVILESFPLRSADMGVRLGSASKGARLEPLFTCEAPSGPAPIEVLPGQAVPDAARLAAVLPPRPRVLCLASGGGS